MRQIDRQTDNENMLFMTKRTYLNVMRERVRERERKRERDRERETERERQRRKEQLQNPSK